YNNWQQAIADRRTAEKIQQMQTMLAGRIHYNDRFFALISTELPKSLDAYQESLEYYDEKSIALISWFVQFLKSRDWEHFHTQIDPKMRQRFLPGMSNDSLLAIRDRQIAFYTKLRQAAEAVPEKFRRAPKDRFRRYDEPPIPEGGYARLQKTFSEKLADQQLDFEGILSIKTYIATDGEILRAKVAQSTGLAILDSLALAVVKDAKWRAAKRDGKLYKTDVIVPLRVWRRYSYE
ncbi:MAG: energy transducer TonB, partial [bacterium]